MAKPLTHVAVRNARTRGAAREIPDPGCVGLYLVVRPTGTKTWVVRYRYRGMPRKLTLGPAFVGESEPADDPAIGTPLSLAAARELATKSLRHAKAKDGIDPAAAKRQRRNAERAAEANTLQAVCEEYLELVEREKPMRTIDQRKADLALLYKPLGQLPLDTIDREQFVKQLDHVSRTRGPVRADRMLMALKRLLKWYSGRRSNYISPLANVERRTSIKDRARTRVLTEDELRRVWVAAEKFPAPFGPYLRFVLLTACRRNEAGGIKLAELLDATTWVIPRARYKTGEKVKIDMLIPLSKAAQAIIAAQPEGNDFIFGGRRPLGNFGRHKIAFDKACGVTGWTIHDLRRTARTLLSAAHDANGVCITPDIAERCLGHALLGQRGTYDLHSYESEKRAAFEALARKIELTVRPPPAAAAIDLASERKRRLRRKA
jgi:integrase